VHRLTAVSLKQRAVVVLLTILIALAGVFAVTRLKTELIPNIEVPILTAITVYPGAGPDSVDQQLSLPITQAVSGLSGVQSTLLTLFVIPVVYELIGGWQDRRAAKQADSRTRAGNLPAQGEETPGTTLE
jgi:multidrug efflux pump subunit AcrB